MFVALEQSINYQKDSKFFQINQKILDRLQAPKKDMFALFLSHFKDKVGGNLEEKINLRKNIIKKVEEF